MINIRTVTIQDLIETDYMTCTWAMLCNASAQSLEDVRAALPDTLKKSQKARNYLLNGKLGIIKGQLDQVTGKRQWLARQTPQVQQERQTAPVVCNHCWEKGNPRGAASVELACLETAIENMRKAKRDKYDGFQTSPAALLSDLMSRLQAVERKLSETGLITESEVKASQDSWEEYYANQHKEN